jgi:hypothetical protein
MTGHKTEAIYRHYAIVDETMLREGADKLAAYQSAEKSSRGIVVPLKPNGAVPPLKCNRASACFGRVEWIQAGDAGAFDLFEVPRY